MLHSQEDIHPSRIEETVERRLKKSREIVADAEKKEQLEAFLEGDCYTFHSLFEEMLYQQAEHLQGELRTELRTAMVPYSEIFFNHGKLLLEAGEVQEAQHFFEKARRWNPVNCDIAFAYIEGFRREGDLHRFYKLTKEQFQYAYRPSEVAQCYRNIGRYFLEMQAYSVAMICYMVSLLYDKDCEEAEQKMKYIGTIAPDAYKETTVEMLMQYEAQYQIPRGADQKVIQLARTCQEEAWKEGELDKAVYFLEILCGLTDEEESLELLELLKERKRKA